ncbi:hypothetical protein SAMN05444972_11050 [Marininema halotolerans]|uniref:Uncharacterized protein n=1 Tax=Marininema halotolerans TaxID=1155944 RepID=A0A1I6TJ00_9BACL|nr:hypothetical protein SAMN05444972_11050 [Marininema halotolerans]
MIILGEGVYGVKGGAMQRNPRPKNDERGRFDLCPYILTRR